jgi:UDP-N-acetylglucosamine 2-epimerase
MYKAFAYIGIIDMILKLIAAITIIWITQAHNPYGDGKACERITDRIG